MSRHHEVECDECGTRTPLIETRCGFGLIWETPAGWHRVDRRDLCSWNCRVVHDKRARPDMIAWDDLPEERRAPYLAQARAAYEIGFRAGKEAS